jgi:hypothetical protein
VKRWTLLEVVWFIACVACLLLMMSGCALIPAPAKVCAPEARLECPKLVIVLPEGPIAGDVGASVAVATKDALDSCATRHLELIKCTQ